MTESRPYPQRARDRIKSTLIIKRLMAHIQGEVDMSSTQIQAERILLAKTLPDLKTAEITGSVQVTQTHRLTDQQLMSIAAGAFQPEAIDGQYATVKETLKLVADISTLGQEIEAGI